MAERGAEEASGRSVLPTLDQISAGGVAFRINDGQAEVAIILVGERGRWQLPKGLIDQGETPETAALREVREEAGIETEIVREIEKVEYWYVAERGGRRVRYHKFVHFFLLRYLTGDVRDHDWEVQEARWVAAEDAARMLSFKGERQVAAKAAVMLQAMLDG